MRVLIQGRESWKNSIFAVSCFEVKYIENYFWYMNALKAYRIGPCNKFLHFDLKVTLLFINQTLFEVFPGAPFSKIWMKPCQNIVSDFMWWAWTALLIKKFRELHEYVCKFANVLRKRGVVKGDRVAIYLPVGLQGNRLKPQINFNTLLNVFLI